MNLRVTRREFSPARTIGALEVLFDCLAFDGRDWHAQDAPGQWLAFGWCCEDHDRGLDKTMSIGLTADLKVPGQTAIGVGLYRLARTPSRRFADRCPDGRMLEVCGVTGFRGIRIHPGNTEADTEGCLLPGLHASAAGVTESRIAWLWLDARVAECEARGEQCSIEITRAPAAWAAWRIGV